MTADLAARRVLMSALLYYECSTNVLSDAEYDELSRLVADRWSDLTPFRQWQLGSPEEIRASGHHVKITVLVEHGARSWHLRVHNTKPTLLPAEWKIAEEWGGLRYRTLRG